jgi:protocatechuate 3,4-dioxygenase alpha subunit
MPGATPSQTIGPFFAEGLQWAVDATASAPFADAVQITGRVLDADNMGVIDALLEIWQPGVPSEVRSLRGFQRVATDGEGGFRFWMPAPASAPQHADVTLFARGLLRGLFTRVYLPGSSGKIDIPSNVPRQQLDSLRVKTLSPGVYKWNIHLCGPDETVFLEL